VERTVEPGDSLPMGEEEDSREALPNRCGVVHFPVSGLEGPVLVTVPMRLPGISTLIRDGSRLLERLYNLRKAAMRFLMPSS